MNQEQQNKIINQVMSRVASSRTTRARVEVSVYSAVLVLSMASLWSSYQYAASVAGQSGFGYYLSLLATDSSYLAGSWNAFMLTVLESAPILGIALMVTAMFFMAYSSRKILGDIRLIKVAV